MTQLKPNHYPPELTDSAAANAQGNYNHRYLPYFRGPPENQYFKGCVCVCLCWVD